MRSGRFSLLLGLVALLFAAEAPALRCGGALVQTEDSTFRVRDLCGEPDYVERHAGVYAGGGLFLGDVEEWYYNEGPHRFIRILTFRDGRLVNEESGGYGFTPGFAGACVPYEIQRGMSKFELYRRCGEPDFRDSRYSLSGGGLRHGSVAGLVRIDEWFYEFGSTYYSRVIRIVNGRVESVELGDR